MNDDQRALASAALDGVLTSEERARAGSDPEVVSETARLRTVRAALRVTDPPDAGRREAAIVAALAAYEAGGATTVAPPRPAVRRRARWMAPAAAAAAVAVIAVGAVVAFQDRGGDDDSAATADLQMSAATAAEGGAAQRSEAPAAAEPEAGESADATASEAAGPAAATETTALPSSGDSGELDSALQTLRSTADLARFATTSVEVDQLAAAANCAGDDFVGAAVYETDGTAIVVEVFVTPDEAVAVRQTTCEEVARTPLD